jgi:hypothetical protein
MARVGALRHGQPWRCISNVMVKGPARSPHLAGPRPASAEPREQAPELNFYAALRNHFLSILF